jgi:hypothetical protein
VDSGINVFPRLDFRFLRRAEPPWAGDSVGGVAMSSSTFGTGVCGMGAVDAVIVLSCEQGSSTGV